MRHLNEEILEEKRVSRVGGSAQGVGPLTNEELSFARLFAVAFLLLFYEHPVFYCGTRVLAPVRLSKYARVASSGWFGKFWDRTMQQPC